MKNKQQEDGSKLIDANKQSISDPDTIYNKDYAEVLNIKDKKYSPNTEGNEPYNPDAGKSSANSSHANLLVNNLATEFEPQASQAYQYNG